VKGKPELDTPRSTELTEKAAAIVDRINLKTKIPKKYLVEEAIINYLPQRYKNEYTAI